VPAVPLHLRGPAAELAAGFDAIRAELGVSATFPPDVLAEVDEVVRRGPSAETDTVVDLRDVPFLTIDPPGAMDLDQALALERAPGGRGGYVFRYAIADVAAFVAAGGAIDAEARRRGVTVYLPDGNAPLHPPALSEGAASLLPDVERQALVWTIRLDADAAPTDVRVERARVRSRRRFTYEEAQALVDAGTEEPLTLLREIGRQREAAEVARGGVSLPLPDQQVSAEGGRYRLEFRAPLPTEGWNAQLSLLAGMAAADLMVAGGIGVLRTLPPPADSTIETLRLRAKALDVDWPAGADYAAVVRALDPAVPRQAALLASAARLFRGAGYLSFDGEAPDGAAGVHAAVAAHYAHVTAPLRRLVDRFGNEIVLALCAGVRPPAWARDALDELPALMAEARRREGSAAGMALDLVEAVVLGGCGGEELRGVVTNTSKGRAMVQVVEPAVVASVDDPKGALEPGQPVRLRVGSTDVTKRSVDLEVVSPPAAHQS
jgi:exoribonuclease R